MKSIIVASSTNHVIGRDNSLIWRQKADIQFFKNFTIGKKVIMGGNTFDSIGKPLPKRDNIVVSKSRVIEGVTLSRTLPTLLKALDHFVVIGGESIYSQAVKYCDEILRTLIHAELDGDKFFPEELYRGFKLIESTHHKADADNQYDYTFEHWVRNCYEHNFQPILGYENSIIGEECINCGLIS